MTQTPYAASPLDLAWPGVASRLTALDFLHIPLFFTPCTGYLPILRYDSTRGGYSIPREGDLALGTTRPPLVSLALWNQNKKNQCYSILNSSSIFFTLGLVSSFFFCNLHSVGAYTRHCRPRRARRLGKGDERMDLFVFAKRAGKWKPAGRYGSAVLPGREASFFFSLLFFSTLKRHGLPQYSCFFTAFFFYHCCF